MERSPAIEVDSTAPMVVCQDCGLVFSLLSNNLISVNPAEQIYAISISQSEAYCLRCLEQIVKGEMREIRLLEERYIYQMEFESYSETEVIKTQEMIQAGTEEKNLTEEIARMEKEEDEVNVSLARLRKQTCELKEKIFSFQVEEEKFWEGINKIERRTDKVEEKSLNTKFDKQMEKDRLDGLSKMSVIHIFTDIVIEDSVGFVQGMAMGKKTEGVDISWQEVAIGLGHLLLSLNFLAVKYGYEYKTIDKIKFSGMHSELTLINKKKLTLFSQKQNDKQIGQTLQILLTETARLSEHILESESIEYSQQFRTPFLMNLNECKIAQLYIDPFKIEERIRWTSWTKVMRYFLINFKHMMTVYAINDKYL